MRIFIILGMALSMLGCGFWAKEDLSWKELTNSAIGIKNNQVVGMNYAMALPLADNHIIIDSELVPDPAGKLELYYFQDNYFLERVVSKTEINYSLVKRDLLRGLSLVKVQDFKIKNVYDFNYDDFPETGEEVFYIGGFENGPSLLKSIVSRNYVDGDTAMIETSFLVKSRYGYNGGYILNKNKEIVAILSSGDEINSCIRLDNIKFFLIDHNLLNLFEKD